MLNVAGGGTGCADFVTRSGRPADSGRSETLSALVTAVHSWPGRGFKIVESLGGLGEGVGEGLVPVHVRALGAQFPRALFAQGCRDDRT